MKYTTQMRRLALQSAAQAKVHIDESRAELARGLPFAALYSALDGIHHAAAAVIRCKASEDDK